MKKLLSMFLVGMMCSSVAIQPAKEETEVLETQEIVETKEVHILTDEELSMLYTCKEDVRNETTISFTYEDAVLLMKLGQCEAGGCAESQYLEMMVVINRLNSDDFPNSIKEVIYQDQQFSVVNEGKFAKAEPTVESHLALAMVEQGIDTSEGALYVEASTNSSESWHSLNKEFLYEVYGQRYYK